MFVIKRSGKKESVKFDKVTARIQKLSYGLSPLVNVIELARKTIEGIYEGVHTTELDNLAAEVSASITNYPKIWEHYKRHEASFWTAEENLGSEVLIINILKQRKVWQFSNRFHFKIR